MLRYHRKTVKGVLAPDSCILHHHSINWLAIVGAPEGAELVALNSFGSDVTVRWAVRVATVKPGNRHADHRA